MKRNYDAIAGMYDTLANIFIGKSLRKAQVYFLKNIPANTNILIAGGGTGWILEEITSVHESGIRIDYVDSSGKMIAIARKRYTGNNSIKFIQKTILDFDADKKYDVIITPFFLDNFNAQTLEKVCNHLHKKLQQKGLWIYTDFRNDDTSFFWQKIMLFVMYRFFRIACNIEAVRLSDVSIHFKKNNYKQLNTAGFLKNFIVTVLYEKL